jgi:sugar/nucleoside kinase (ribokinase family)
VAGVIRPAVVVIGDVMTDVTIHSDADLTHDLAHGSDTAADIRLGGGGAGGNVAAWLAFLGVQVGLVAAVGDDDAGDLALAGLQRRGVAVHAVRDPTRPTGTVVALVDARGERTMITDRGANVALSPRDVPMSWFGPGARLHLSGYTLFTRPARSAALAALGHAASCGMGISVDPASWAPLRQAEPARFLAWTAAADLCLPNADEARLLAGTDDLDAAARRLGARYGQAIITAGADGAVWSDGRAVLREPAGTHADVLTGIGAGDAFTAGYLAALHRGATPRDALAAAVDVAGSALRRPGARPD